MTSYWPLHSSVPGRETDALAEDPVGLFRVLALVDARDVDIDIAREQAVLVRIIDGPEPA